MTCSPAGAVIASGTSGRAGTSAYAKAAIPSRVATGATRVVNSPVIKDRSSFGSASGELQAHRQVHRPHVLGECAHRDVVHPGRGDRAHRLRSEEHTSELQSPYHLVR